jgi:hypothetical protein
LTFGVENSKLDKGGIFLEVDMLITYEQAKFLDAGVNDDSFVFIDNGIATDEERRSLIDMDAFWFEQEGYHFIDNYRDLYKAGSAITPQTVSA